MKPKKYNKIKDIKRKSRADTGLYGKSGVHQDKTRREKYKPNFLEDDMEEVKIGFSNILSAFDSFTVGSKVLLKSTFMDILEDAVKSHDFSSERVAGQALIELSQEACRCVSAGVGKRTNNLNDYIIRHHRGQVKLFFNRDKADDVPDNVKAVVYTLDAYLNDPDVDEQEAKEILDKGYTHILVAVLASKGPPSPLSPTAFVHNLAGGNNEALVWTADEIREKAGEIENYYSEWITLSD